MGSFSFKLPDLGEGIVESEIVEWYVKTGDVVEEDQHIADVMTDKAVVEVTAPVSGIVTAIACEAGEMLAVGKELIRFDTEACGSGTSSHASASDAQDQNNSVSQPKPADITPKGERTSNSPNKETVDQSPPVACSASPSREAPLPVSNGVSGTVLASPSVRQRARDEQVNLADVPGSGPAGRISHKDLDDFIASGGVLASPAGLRSRRNGQTDVKIKGLRRVIAQKMLQTKRNIPHYSYVEEVDVTALEELRQHLNANRESHQPKLTLLPFIMQALVKALPKFPHCNAHYDDETSILTQFEAVHMGIATMTNAGLMVPVIKHSESLDLWQSASEVSRVSEAARNNTAKADELSGSSITITSLGALGGIVSTPIINAPETAIIGINKLQERPVVKDGAIVIRKMMNLSASFDHRIVDGYDGAQLIQALKRLLENPGAIFV
ncbi:dihydrolipoamide acetyltransferase family protein [Hahella ganghwensis]|uniref:dihydrolipoamide acetyltransferase family protein n=1 Tax=Hahella ganghwensis TaxID=286420 RepID=UPI00036AFE3E|nr:dihydrolipoamide acetyltransferase family protein [Hahella ganghwensis]